MSGSVAFLPMQTTNYAGGFSIKSDGFVQGVAMDAPSVRYQLAGGILAPTETLPMWGGVAIYEDSVGGLGASSFSPENLGTMVGRATSIANLTGFSAFNQAHHMIQTAQSQVPTAQVNMSVNFFRLGTGARIPVAMDPALISSLTGQLITSQVSWDFVNQRLVPYYGTDAAIAISSITSASANGVVTATLTSASAHGLAVGDDFNITGAVPLGYNGAWTVASVPSSTTLTYVLLPAATAFGNIAGLGGGTPISALAASTASNVTTLAITTSIPHGLSASNTFTIVNAVPAAYNGGYTVASVPTTTTLTATYLAAETTGGTVASGGGALPVRILKFNLNGSKTVSYNSTTNTATWNNASSAALILI